MFVTWKRKLGWKFANKVQNCVWCSTFPWGKLLEMNCHFILEWSIQKRDRWNGLYELPFYFRMIHSKERQMEWFIWIAILFQNDPFKRETGGMVYMNCHFILEWSIQNRDRWNGLCELPFYFRMIHTKERHVEWFMWIAILFQNDPFKRETGGMVYVNCHFISEWSIQKRDRWNGLCELPFYFRMIHSKERQMGWFI